MAEGKQRGGCAKIIALGVLLFAIVAAFTGWRVHQDYLRFADAELSIGADELVLEVCQEEIEQVSGILREAMEHVVELDVPLSIDIHSGKNWAEAK